MRYITLVKTRAVLLDIFAVLATVAIALHLAGSSELAYPPALAGGAALALNIVLSRVFTARHLFHSRIEGFAGLCTPTWLNTNRVCVRQTGLTGFFKMAKKVPGLPLYYRTGEEFHGRMTNSDVVSTDSRLRDICWQGTDTGRWRSADSNESNTPKSA